MRSENKQDFYLCFTHRLKSHLVTFLCKRWSIGNSSSRSFNITDLVMKCVMSVVGPGRAGKD